MHRGYKYSKSTKKINHSMYVDIMKLFTKKRIGNSDTNNKNIQPRDRNGTYHQKCAMLRNKRRTRMGMIG